MMIARVWRKHALKPHRVEGYMASNDPDFEKKAADIIGLYLNPPEQAIVLSKRQPGRITVRFGIARSAARCASGWCVGPSSPRPIESWVKT